jgi:hypothetical protein
MKSETVKRIMEAIDAGMQRLGQKNWDEGIEFATRFFNIPDGVLGFKVGNADRVISRAELEKLFSKEPEPTQSELQELIKAIKKMPGSMRKQFLQAAKSDLPRDLGGRGSVRGDPQEQNRRTQEVTSLIGKGLSHTDAIKRVARKYGISTSSMWRTWTAMKKPNDESSE